MHVKSVDISVSVNCPLIPCGEQVFAERDINTPLSIALTASYHTDAECTCGDWDIETYIHGLFTCSAIIAC